MVLHTEVYHFTLSIEMICKENETISAPSVYRTSKTQHKIRVFYTIVRAYLDNLNFWRLKPHIVNNNYIFRPFQNLQRKFLGVVRK